MFSVFPQMSSKLRHVKEMVRRLSGVPAVTPRANPTYEGTCTELSERRYDFPPHSLPNPPPSSREGMLCFEPYHDR